jgi:hypothetical protein
VVAAWVAAAWGRLPGGGEARVSGSEKKYQALITMSEEMDCSGIGCLYCSMGGIIYRGEGPP